MAKSTRLPLGVARRTLADGTTGYRAWWIDRHGSRKWSKTFADLASAAELAARQRRLFKKDADLAETLTLGDAIELLRQDLAEKGSRAGTLEWYELQFEALLRCWRSDSRLASIDRFELEWMMKERQEKDGVGPQTVRHHLQVMRRLFRLAQRHGAAVTDAVSQVNAPRVDAHEYTLVEWSALNAAVIEEIVWPDTWQRDAVLLLLRTGMRLGELCRLEPSDLDGEGRLRIDGKRGGRILPLPDASAELVRQVLPWPVPDVGKKRKQTMRRATDRVKRHVGELGAVNPHALRHTVASRLARLGHPEHVIADVLGHARRSFSVTSRYIAADGPAIRAALLALCAY